MDELRKFMEDSILRTSKAHLIRIYIEALDEYGEKIAGELVKDFQRLTRELASAEATLSIYSSCRHYPILALENGLTVCVEDENRQDIVIYVRDELELGFSDKSEAQEIETTIVGRAKGVFQ
jgi:hypothetical protein